MSYARSTEEITTRTGSIQSGAQHAVEGMSGDGNSGR
jgi:hypothetical protein